MDLQPIADEIAATLRPQVCQQCRVATYIPALSRVRADPFWIALRTGDGTEAAAGDCDVPFSIQSVRPELVDLANKGQRPFGPRHGRRVGSCRLGLAGHDP